MARRDLKTIADLNTALKIAAISEKERKALITKIMSPDKIVRLLLK